MPWGFVKDAANLADGGGAATTIAATLASAAAAGNLVVGWVGWEDSGSTNISSVSDGTNTYTLIGSKLRDATNGQSMQLFYKQNIAGSPTTVTVTFSASIAYRRIGIAEYSGIETSGALDANASQAQASPGTGTDAVSSSALTTTVANDLVFAAHQNVGESDPGTGTISAGTGYSARAQTGTAIGRMEDKNQASAGSVSGTFTFSSNHRSLTCAAAFKQAAALPSVSSWQSTTLSPVAPINVAPSGLTPLNRT